MKTIKAEASNVDDGVSVYRNGIKFLHVNYKSQGSKTIQANVGDTIAFVVENLTGGPWSANLRLTVGGEVVYEDSPMDNTLVQMPNPQAYRYEYQVS
jgi:hypothetical protein